MRLTLTFLLPALLAAQSPTVVHDAAAKAKLLGVHGFTCQWVQWGKEKGKVEVTEERGRLRIKGEQVSNKTGDRASIEGEILEVKSTSFLFRGRVLVQVSYLNGGKPCERNGDFDFQIRGGRKFWRMHPMENPCDPPTVDYVDVHF